MTGRSPEGSRKMCHRSITDGGVDHRSPGENNSRVIFFRCVHRRATDVQKSQVTFRRLAGHLSNPQILSPVAHRNLIGTDIGGNVTEELAIKVFLKF